MLNTKLNRKIAQQTRYRNVYTVTKVDSDSTSWVVGLGCDRNNDGPGSGAPGLVSFSRAVVLAVVGTCTRSTSSFLFFSSSPVRSFRPK